MIALITGIAGQDGSYLAEFLLNKGYIVHGIIRRSSSFNTGRINHLINDNKLNDKFHLHYGDVTDSNNINRLLVKIKPDEIYNLAAQSHVKVSFEIPIYTTQVDAMGTLRFLEAIQNYKPDTKLYQASTSELFGKAVEMPQNEETPFQPCSPYGIAKLYGYWIIVNYRESYNIYSCNGILFNHESPRRGGTFVTRKITTGVARIKLGLQKKIVLGNLNSVRDWGYAPEYIEGMWLMMQQDKPDDYILATGENYSVRQFVEEAFNNVNIKVAWEGAEDKEVGKDTNTGNVVIEVDPKYYRPVDIINLVGDYSKAKKILKWEPRTKFKQLVEIMVDADLKRQSQLL